MQLILVKIKWHIKWKYLIQKFHDICLSYYYIFMGYWCTIKKIVISFRKGTQIPKFCIFGTYVEFYFFIQFACIFSLWNDCMDSFCFWKYVIRFSLSLMVSEIDLSYRGKQKLNSKIWTFFFSSNFNAIFLAKI